MCDNDNAVPILSFLAVYVINAENYEAQIVYIISNIITLIKTIYTCEKYIITNISKDEKNAENFIKLILFLKDS